MILGLVLFQVSIGIVAVLAEPFTSRTLPPRQWLATEEARFLLERSITRGPQGELVFAPTPSMTAYMAGAPDFWFIAADGARLVHGGAAVGAADDGDKSTIGPAGEAQGTVTLLNSRAGRIGVLLGGQRGDLLDGIAAWLGDRLRGGLALLAVSALCTTALIIALVYLLLRPVRHAARAAAALNPGQPSLALPEDGVPVEILPLVSATNTALARLERERERQRRFIANAAHELRTPLAILSFRLDALPDSDTKARLRQDLRRLSVLADQLLDLERLHRAGAAPAQRLDLVALTREVVADMAPLAIEIGGSLAFDTSVARWDISGDEQALRGVFMNLISNALTHGGPGIRVDLTIGADRVIEVADHGTGVSADARERLFEAFHRAGRSGGTGLGLYIAREVLRAHGARIDLVDGRPGAVFRIAF